MMTRLLRKFLAVALVIFVPVSCLPVQAIVVAESARIEAAAVAPTVLLPTLPALTATPLVVMPDDAVQVISGGQASAMPQRALLDSIIAEAVSAGALPETARDRAAVMLGEERGQRGAETVVTVGAKQAGAFPRRSTLGRRVVSGVAALAASMAVALPASAAQAQAQVAQAEGLPASVKWVAGIGGFVGLILGSIVPTDGWKLDFPGAVAGAAAVALTAGGAAQILVDSQSNWGFAAAGLGIVMGLLRWGNLPRPKPVVMTSDLMTFEGIPMEKIKQAKRAFDRLAIPTPNPPNSDPDFYLAPRGYTYYYGAGGMAEADSKALSDTADTQHFHLYSPVALFLRSLPDRPGEPGIVVVRRLEELQAMRVSNGEIVVGSRVVARTKDVAGLTFFRSDYPVTGL